MVSLFPYLEPMQIVSLFLCLKMLDCEAFNVVLLFSNIYLPRILNYVLISNYESASDAYKDIFAVKQYIFPL